MNHIRIKYTDFSSINFFLSIILWHIAEASYVNQIDMAVSSWCHGYSDGLRNRSTRVRTPVALLRSLSGKYAWERYESPYPPSYGLNSTTTVLLGE